MKQKSIIKTLALLLLLAVCPSVSAETSDAWYLVVTDGAGAQTVFALADQPATSFDGSDMTVAAGETSVTVSLAELASYELTQDVETTGIKAATTSNTEFSNGKALVSGLTAGAVVSVYSIDGRMVSSEKADSDGRVSVDLTGLQSGAVYIIRTPGASYKVLNK